MSEEQNVYQRLNGLIEKKIADKERLQELSKLKMRKLVESDKSSIEAMKDFLSTSEPLLNTMYEDSNEIQELESTVLNSTTPFVDSFRDLRVYLDENFLSTSKCFLSK